MGYNNDNKKAFKPIKSQIKEEIKRDLEYYIKSFQDPVILGEMVYKLLEERENTNRLLKTLLEKIERIEKQMKSNESEKPKTLLPAIDKKILEFLKQGPKTAEDVRKAFNYKGKNAASARLNKLFKLGLVKKENVGKTVYFMLT